ncbi:WD domain, G-beta repeat [Plasmodiophora brassicae]
MEQYPLQPILCVSGLRADLLREVPLCMNPVVRVSVVDVQTGQLLEKAHPQWSVVTRYESPGSRILPVQTEPWDIVGRRVLAPVWEEPVIFNESLQHFFQHRVLILFEILDFGPHVNLNMYPSGTLPIAWAFVKPLSASGAPNHGHIRVQLYEYTREAATRERSGALRPYVEYVVQKNCGFVPYPSSLYLNLRGIAPLRSRIVRGKRPRLPTDIEQGRIGYDEMRSKFGPASPTDTPGHARDSAPVSTRQRSNCRQRLRGDPCLVPNEEAGRLSSGTLGAFVVEFSPDGRFVAAACAEYLMFPVKLFDSDGGTLEHTFAGHYGLVHDLAWSADARFLASASADNTVKIWAKERGVSAIASLQHLAFVYSARFVPTHDIDAVVVTAGVDRVVRVWDALQGAVIHELSGHDAPINSIAVDQQGLRMWTGDASGSVKSWDRDLPQSASRFRPVHRLQHPELKDVAITSVRHDPVRDSIVVMARNHLLYVFGVRRYDLRRVLSGVQCDHSAIRAQFSPDGAFVVSGSEDGKVHVWRVASGELVSQIETGYTAACYGVAWHPSQHLIAACSFGGDYPIMVFDCIDGSGAAPDPVASADSPRRQTHLPGAIS